MALNQMSYLGFVRMLWFWNIVNIGMDLPRHNAKELCMIIISVLILGTNVDQLLEFPTIAHG